MSEDAAAILMEHLPPVGWADVATKHDLAELEGRLGHRLDASVSELRAELHKEVGTLRSDLEGQVGSLRSDLQAEIGQLDTSLRGEVARLGTELRGEIGALRAELHVATRTYLYGSVGLALTVAAVTFGASQLA